MGLGVAVHAVAVFVPFLPTIELVVYPEEGEWKYALTIFDHKLRGITSIGCFGDNRSRAMRDAVLLAKRLGLTRVRARGSRIWRKLEAA